MPPIATQRQRREAPRDLEQDVGRSRVIATRAIRPRCRATTATTITHSERHCRTPTATNTAAPDEQPAQRRPRGRRSRIAVPRISPAAAADAPRSRCAPPANAQRTRRSRDQQHHDRPARTGCRVSGDQRADRTVPARAEDHRQVDDVRPGRIWHSADQLGELALGQPAALVDEHAPRPRHHAAEAEQSHLQEAAKQRRAADAGERSGLVAWVRRRHVR